MAGTEYAPTLRTSSSALLELRTGVLGGGALAIPELTGVRRCSKGSKEGILEDGLDVGLEAERTGDTPLERGEARRVA